MVEVTRSSANWRLFGGGGFLLAAIVWGVGLILSFVGVVRVGGWLVAAAYLLVALAHVFVAFGQTGSNGAVGASAWGKTTLIGAAAGWTLWAGITIANSIVGPTLAGAGVPRWLPWVAFGLIVFGGITAGIEIFLHGIAGGFAKWAYFVPVAWAGVTLVISLFVRLTWPSAVLAALVGLTGLAYLFNRADLKNLAPED